MAAASTNSRHLVGCVIAENDKGVPRARLRRVTGRCYGVGDDSTLPMIDVRHRSAYPRQIFEIHLAKLEFADIAWIYHCIISH